MTRARRKGRDVHGILLLDKPAGISSNGALQMVKRLYQARRAGHTGSLDQIATGMLPVCLGEATKLSGFLLDADKRYRAVVKLGVRTSTGDIEGDVLEVRPVGTMDLWGVRRVLSAFKGPIQQIPPMHSAIKHRGQPLYKLAHQGLAVERKPRTVVVREIELLGMDADEMELEVLCSKGTYIRTLAEDIGAALAVGAHVRALRRLAVGAFGEREMVGLDTVERAAGRGLDDLDALLVPMDSALMQWPAVKLSRDTSYYLCMGQPVLVPHAPTEGWVRLYGDQRFLGIGQVQDDGRIAPRRLVQGCADRGCAE
jgi:tRNA pseudouridine55 synthase